MQVVNLMTVSLILVDTYIIDEKERGSIWKTKLHIWG